ncbi:MAG TPA: fasciclin domain-containing protein [Rhizomicrobium sp.]|nr:fasciclin domain-containing protein [Rhizomicrobium sp.]
MKRHFLAGFAAAAAMMIGGALGAVSSNVVSGAHAAKPAQADAPGNAEVMNPMIAGQAMLANRNLLENISASPEHAMLAAAMKDSGVADALKTDGQFTVFAPTDAALAKLSAQVLIHDKAGLARLMSYLVVPGKYDSQALLKVIGEGGGQAKLRTAEGGMILAKLNGPTNILLTDEEGNTADIAIYDVYDKNGVMHVVDHMLQPGAARPQVAGR